MEQVKAKIISNERIAPDFCRMRVKSAYLARNSKPGQFVEVKCSSGGDPILRRPLGVHRAFRGGIEMLYEIAGKGTALLSKMAKGGTVDIIGPLGRGFELKNIPAVIIAGGVGVAPLVYLAETLAEDGKSASVIIGAKRKSHIMCEQEFKRAASRVLIATEDGSKGHKGLATELLKKELKNKKIIYACGPAPMLKAVAAIAKESRIECQVSLEERMACGVGVCLGCPVKVRKGSIDFEYKMVCKDGPVFDAKEIVW